MEKFEPPLNLLTNVFIMATPISSSKIPMISPLSSPRAQSARAVTGRRNSYRWEGGRLFEPSAGFFTETAVTPERKVEKSFPRWEINRHVEG